MAEVKAAAPTEAPRRRVREMEVEVVRIRRDTPDTSTLFLSSGTCDYRAGHFLTIDPHQFVPLESFTSFLEDVKGQREKPRAYSLASAPHEPHLAITIKAETYIRGETPYPPLLSPLLTYQITTGTRLKVRGFTGAYTWPPDITARTERVAHVCAGSGIVPNFALIKDSLHRGDGLHHTLLYSSKTRQDIIYFDELEKLQRDHPAHLRVIHCITREDPSGLHNGRPGRITRDLLAEVIADPPNAFAFLCGPGISPYERKAARGRGEEPAPRFVEHMAALVEGLGLGKQQVKRESWG